MNLYLGIDTSCYTTSVAAFTEAGELLADERSPLVVAAGRVGLRQSEMVFQHNRHLAPLLERVRAVAGVSAVVRGVCASTAPGQRENSYMPAFTVGANYGRAVAAMLGDDCFFHSVTHQENHVLAGLWGSGSLHCRELGVIHLSGGTTEVLHVRRSDDGRMNCELLAASKDINAGQFIDRIGVQLGLPFPAGPHLERLAVEHNSAQPSLELPTAVRGLQVSFSGPESEAKRRLQQGAEPVQVAAAVQHCIARSLGKLLKNCYAAAGLTQFLLVGGVSANTYLRQYLTEQLPQPLQAYFPPPRCCGDGAIGCACAAWEKSRREG